MGGGISGRFFSSRHQTCAYATLPEANSGRPTALDEKHSLLTSPRSSGSWPHVCSAVRSLGADGCGGERPCGARNWPFGGSVREPGCAVDRSGLGRDWGSPRFVFVVALPCA